MKLFPDTMNQEDMHSELEYYIMFGKRSDSSHCQLRGVLFSFFFFFNCAWSYLWHNLCFEMQVLLVAACMAFSSVQLLSLVQLFLTPWAAARQASLSHITNSPGSLKLMSIQLVMPSNHLILCHPLLLLPSILPSIRVFSKKSVLHTRWSKYWSFSFSISPSNEYSGLISFRMDWLDLLAVQGTFKSLL